MWPDLVHCDEVQSRLIHDGMPVERAMGISSEVRTLVHGDRYRIERTQGNIMLYAQGAGWYRVVSAD